MGKRAFAVPVALTFENGLNAFPSPQRITAWNSMIIAGEPTNQRRFNEPQKDPLLLQERDIVRKMAVDFGLYSRDARSSHYVLTLNSIDNGEVLSGNYQ